VSTKFYDDYCRRKLKIVKNFIRKTDSILDIGCGNPTEIFCVKEFKKYPKWVGLDLNPPKNENRIIKGDILKMNIKKFDVVLCIDVLEHFKNPKPVIKKLCKIADKKLIIVTPITSSILFRRFLKIMKKVFGMNIFQGHFHEFFKNEIINMTSDFNCKKIFYIEFPVVWLSKLLFNSNLLKSGIFIFERDK